MTPQEWRSSRLKSSPPPIESRRTSYTPGPADESFPEEEEGDWDPPMRSVVGTLTGWGWGSQRVTTPGRGGGAKEDRKASLA